MNGHPFGPFLLYARRECPSNVPYRFKSLLRRRLRISRRECVADHIDFRYAVCIADFHTGDVAVADQLIGQMTADAQHRLNLRHIYNVGVVREHHLV